MDFHLDKDKIIRANDGKWCYPASLIEQELWAEIERLTAENEKLRPALEHAFACGGPAVVNVLTDPTVEYPRRSNLG